jgi:hypothetical protein
MLTCSISPLHAQVFTQTEGKIINQQIWLDFYPHFFINEKLEYYGDAGYRANIVDFSWHRVYVRPSVKYHLNKTFEAHAGLGVFYIFDRYDINRLEVTPWQGVQANWPKLERIGIQHLIKLEERFSFYTSIWNLEFNLRVRYKLSGKIDISKKNKFYIPVYGEIFIPINDEINEIFRNRGRAGMGIGYYVSKDWQLEFIMNWQRSRIGPDDELSVSDYAYQLKIKKRWKSSR